MEFMDFNEYQKKAVETAIYPEKGTGSKLALAYTALGLGNEAGECQGKVKKWLRGDSDLTKEKRLEILDEASDVLWYLAALVEELGFDLSVAADRNIAKLQDRKERGVIKGNGDTR
jgi:NTP pyrophosphatase (non-canonical NTP hydrolase)